MSYYSDALQAVDPTAPKAPAPVPAAVAAPARAKRPARSAVRGREDGPSRRDQLLAQMAGGSPLLGATQRAALTTQQFTEKLAAVRAQITALQRRETDLLRNLAAAQGQPA